jgi:capsular exopolysaccharide synthesis family protein
LALGVSAAFAASFGKDFLARANEVRIEADLPLIATIPEANLSLKNGTAQTHEQSLPFRDAPHSRVSEAFRVLRYSLQLASPPSRVFMVASTLQGEGRTFVAANLAAAFAETGRRVILLDADMRHPSLHRVFSAPHNVGLSDLLNDRASSVEDTLQLTSIKDLWLMPAGSKPMDSIKLLESRAFELIVNKLKAMADVVIVDVPETLGLVDSIVVARLVDSALLVVQNREGLQSAVLRAKQILQAAGTRINGIVLNRGTQLQGYAAEVREGRLQSESVPGHLSN